MEESNPQIVNSPVETVKTTPVKNNNNFLVSLLSVLLLLSAFIAGFFAYQTQKLVIELSKSQTVSTPIATIVPSPTPLETPVATDSATTISSPVACTMEAKICPDGSAVGRSGPKCEFAACPTTSPLP
jgi:predicted PurR-regulated permease PerM